MKIKNREKAIELLKNTLGVSISFENDIFFRVSSELYVLHLPSESVVKVAKMEIVVAPNEILDLARKVISKKESNSDLPKEFAVQSKDFETYKRFKEEVEKFGWAVCFEDLFNNNFFQKNKTLYLQKSQGEFNFYLVRNYKIDTSIYNIDKPEDYQKAITHAKELIGYKEDEKDLDVSSIEWQPAKQGVKYRTTTLEEIGLSDEQLAKINPVHPAMDKLNQLIEKYEIQKDFANELIGFDVALKLITKMLIDLKELKEQLK